MDPAIWRATGDGLVALVEDSGAAQLVPDLATAVPQPTDGGRTYTFHLRRGLRYSTGVPVLASDVRRELERLFGVGSDLAGSMAALRGAPACAQRPASCDLSAGVTTDDRAGTIVFHLSRPDPELLFKLASPAARPVPPGTPRTYLAARPVPSTGPYRVGAFEPGRRLLLVRNPRFHEWSRAAQPDGFPDRIEIAMDADPQARVQAVLAGRSDVALEVASANLAPLRTGFASQLRLHAQPHTSFLNFNVRRSPFDDVRARQAVNLALDRAVARAAVRGPRPVDANLPGAADATSPGARTTARGPEGLTTVAGTGPTCAAPERSSALPGRLAPPSRSSPTAATASDLGGARRFGRAASDRLPRQGADRQRRRVRPPGRRGEVEHQRR